MIRQLCKILIGDIFKLAIALYVVLFVMEWVKTGLVTNYFNPNIILIILIISGIITALVSVENQERKSNKLLKYFLYLILAILFLILISQQLVLGGKKEMVVAILSAIVLFIGLILIEKND